MEQQKIFATLNLFESQFLKAILIELIFFTTRLVTYLARLLHLENILCEPVQTLLNLKTTQIYLLEVMCLY